VSGLTPIVLSALLGLVCVELFGGAWLGLLGILAAVIQWSKGCIDGQRCLGRIHRFGALGLLKGLALTLAFVLYLKVLGLGFAPLEMMAFFLGAVVGQIVFFASVIERINGLFVRGADPDHPDDGN